MRPFHEIFARLKNCQCDEAHPVCRNCKRHDLSCHYDRPTTPRNKDGSRTVTRQLIAACPLRLDDPADAVVTGSGTLIVDAVPLNETEEFSPSRQLDLRLLHNFTIRTSKMLPGTDLEHIRKCWSITVPELAFQHEPLLYQILCISALHLSIETGFLDPGLNACHLLYSEKALRGHRETIKSVDRQSADATCFNSVLILVGAFASLQERRLEPYIPPITWLQLAQGTGTIMAAAIDAIGDDKTTKFYPIVSSSTSFSVRKKNVDDEDRRNIYRLISPATFRFLLSTGDNNKYAAIYEDTLAYIAEANMASENGEHDLQLSRRLMAFPILTPKEFTAAIHEQKVEALIILAHFFAMSARLSHIWWVGSVAQNEILAIAAHIGPRYSEHLHWPMEAIRSSVPPRFH